MQHSTSSILSICNDIFNPESCHQMACKHGFIQRKSSKIFGPEFLSALIVPSAGCATDSLNGLCARMAEFNPNANISASALIQRINTKAAVQFTMAAYEKILTLTREKMIQQDPSITNVLKHFRNIYIQDSTIFEMNKELSRFFPGTKRGGKKGGSSCKSQMKIDLIHNLATGRIERAQIHEGKRPDQASSGVIERIVKVGDLVMRDLGYFKIESLSNIDELGAYFLSRFPSHLKVYLSAMDEKPVDLAEHLNKKYKNSTAIDLTVWVSDKRLQVRLVAYRLPERVISERHRKANKSAKETGRTLSRAKKTLLEFSIFVTNIPSSLISVDVIGTIYRLRWEIELIFKQCKSDLQIDVLRGVCRHRILCLAWARLCMIMIVSCIAGGFSHLAKGWYQVELSSVKLIRYILRNGILCRAIKEGKLQELEDKIIQEIPKRLKKEKRSRKTMRQRANDLEGYYEACNKL